jgi:poly-gamma-glutamate synthesis protein (capsule biosynthesis protein)
LRRQFWCEEQISDSIETTGKAGLLLKERKARLVLKTDRARLLLKITRAGFPLKVNLVREVAVLTLLTFLAFFLSTFPFGASTAQEKVTFCAVGDVMLDRGVRAKIEQNGVDYPFGETAEFFKAHDLAFCNLECTISARGTRLSKAFAFRGDTSFVDGLRKSGLNTFCLANNHTLDYGREAFLDTKDVLERNGFHVVGAGKSQKEASKATVVEVNGMTFAFLASVDIPLDGIAYSEGLPGPAQTDIKRIVEEIHRVRKEADFVIVSFHWGAELSPLPSERQKAYAHRVIDEGADLVIGHHTHAIQSIENYKGKFIVYSLGNFVFDSRRPEGKETLIFACLFTDKGIELPSITPVIMRKCRPTLAQGQDSLRILDRVKTLSKRRRVTFRECRGALFLEAAVDTTERR